MSEAAPSPDAPGINDPANKQSEESSNQVLIFIILLGGFLALVVITCLILKRFFAYKTMANNANEAPLAACTYFEKSDGTYRQASSKISKNNLRDINLKIRDNRKSIQTHIPPLTYDPLNDLNDNFIALNNETLTGRDSRHEPKLQHLSAQDSYYTTHTDEESHCSQVMKKKSFAQLRKRFLKDTGYVPRDRGQVMSVEKIYGHQNSVPARTPAEGSNRGRDRGEAENDDDSLSTASLGSLRGPGRSTYYRQQALEYALKIDKLLIKINDRDPRLKRHIDCRYNKHFSNIRELSDLKDAVDHQAAREKGHVYRSKDKKPYEEGLGKIDLKSIYEFTTHIEAIRYGSESYTFEKLENTKRVVDLFSNEIIQKSGIPWLTSYYKNID